MKRRSFIKKSAVSTAMVSTIPIPNIILNKRKDKLGYALVGLGNYASNQLAPALLETQHTYLAGIVTGSPEKADEFADKYDIPSKNIYNYDNYDEIAKNKDIDIIYVVLPNNMHAEYTIRGLQAGKHVTCEKPMATNYADALKMIAAAKKAKKRLSIGYRLHYDPFNLEMMRLGQKKVHGEIKEIHAGFGFNLTDKKRWRLDKTMAGGGPLMDVGIYAMQATMYTLGQLPTSLRAIDTTKNKAFYGDVEGSLTWQFQFDSGVKSTMISSYENEYYDFVTAKTDTTTFGLSPAYVYNGLKGEVGGKPMDIKEIYQQAAQMDAYAYNLKTKTDCIASAEMGARDMFIIDKIYESIAMGKDVSLKGMPQVQHLL